MKRILSAFLALMLIFPAFVFGAKADSSVNYTLLEDYSFDFIMNSEDSRALWDNLTDAGSLSRGYIDLERFNIPYTAKNLYALKTMLDGILYFGLYSDLVFTGSDCVSGMLFTPSDPSGITEAWMYLDMMADRVREIPGLSEEEKVWLLQDALVSKISYAKGAYGGQTVVEAMRDGICVCAGYAKTFMVLCRKCGIECYYMEGSGSPAHAWNIVRINGKLYYADPTWDDNDNKAVIGFVKHKYLLSSPDVFGHEQYKFWKIPESNTEFDTAEWKKSNSRALYFNGDIYYVDLYLQANVYHLRRAGDPDFYISLNNSFSNLVSDGKNILVSQKKAVYKVDIEKMRLGECVYTLSDEDKAAGLGIFGLTLEDGKLIMDLAKSSLYVISASTEVVRREAEYNGYIADTRCYFCTENKCSEKLDLLCGFSGRGKTAGYYFGTDTAAENNIYTNLPDGEHTARLTVTSPGTYYLTAKDADGTLSTPLSFTAVKTEVNVPGGTSYSTLNIKDQGFFPEQYAYGDAVHFAESWTESSGTLTKAEHKWLYTPETNGTLTAVSRSGLVYGITRYSLEKDDLTQFIRWELDTDSPDGVLHLAGKGRTGTFLVSHPAPWYEYRTSVRKIEIGEGITVLGTQCFKDFTKVETVILPSTLTEVYQSAFKNCKALKSVLYGGTDETRSAIIWDERGGNDPIIAADWQYIVRGDVDGDGKRNAKDVNLLKQIVLGTYGRITAADINGDGKVTVSDVVFLKILVLG